MTTAEEVKARLDIVDVVREYVPLKPAGANWRARCPFHEERTPSFMVSKPKQIWHCFGCGEGGDVFTFVMKSEGLEFPDALRLLAEKAGVRLRAENVAERTERQRLLALLDAAANFWSETLWQDAAAREARRYLQDERRLLPETVRAWRLGFAPDSWEALVLHLGKLGYAEAEMVNAGVAARRVASGGRGAYDRFRNRIMFPITNAHGQVIGATGRTLAGVLKAAAPTERGAPAAGGGDASPGEAKYVNTPETLLYHKGQVLYGLDKARGEVRKQDLAVLVEGNLDVVSSHQAGVVNVVAASGTALTDEQVRALRRYTDNVAFSFDADAAGETATRRGLATALAAGLNVSLIRLPRRADGRPYKDPDECVRENPDLWRQAIAGREAMMEHYFRRAVEGRNLTTLEGKQAAVRLLLPLIARLPDAVASAHYLQKLAALVQVSEAQLREALPRPAAAGAGPRRRGPESPGAPAARPAPVDHLTDRLLAALLAAPGQASYVADVVPPDMLSASGAELYREMVVFYTETQAQGQPDWLGAAFAERLARRADGADCSAKLAVLSLLADKEFSGLAPADVEHDLLGTVKRLRRHHLRGSLQRLERDIRTAEQSADADPERLAALIHEFQAASTELVKLDNGTTRP